MCMIHQDTTTFDGLAHVSDVLPTLLSLVDQAGAGAAHRAATPPHWSEGMGYDLSQALLMAAGSIAPDTPQEAAAGADVGEGKVAGLSPRPDVLMAWDVPTNKTGYRFGKWKLLLGNPGDSRRFGEPQAGAWIGEDVFDYAVELVMHFQHWAHEVCVCLPWKPRSLFSSSSSDLISSRFPCI